jgi:glyoxylase-like metal-dependent hydrolase (beta-lactamase superfamily II)
LPGGSEPLIPLQWQPLPGDEGTRIYPFIRKVDTDSSNSYLIQTPDALLLIDPGGLPEQADRLSLLIQEIRIRQALPLIVILTHGHVDHYVGALSSPLLCDPKSAVVAVQERGVQVVESADRRMTQAAVLGRELPPLRIDLPLLTAASAPGGSPVQHTYANGVTLLQRRTLPQYGLPHEELILGNGPPVGIYHTPGHSPDSCCIQIGRVLFSGDLLFATSPGIAGISGWDQEALIRSLEGVRAILSTEEIEVICSGHGLMLSAKDALRILDAVQKDAPRLSGIAELDPDRARQTAEFAEDCMEQVNELFTVMAGRLYYVSHLMEELGETDIADGLKSLIRGDVIDDVLESFDAFNREYQSGRWVPLNLALKGGQVVGKLQRSFDQDQLAQIIDPTLVHRAKRLLDDYLTMLRGFMPPRNFQVYDLREILEARLTAHTLRASSDEDILASVDDGAAFGQMLLARIGMPPLLADTEVTIDLGLEPLNVILDRDRFLDLVTYLLEDLVGSDARRITVRALGEGDAVLVILSGEGGNSPVGGSGRPLRFLYGLCERAGGILCFENPSHTRMYTLRFTRSI